MTKICCISDTHEQHEAIDMPEADILIHAGDATWKGEIWAIKEFNEWLGKIKDRYRHIIVIAGNHDFFFEKHYQSDPGLVRRILSNALYLQDELCHIPGLGLNIYGSPYSPRFHDWAFNLDRGPAIRAKWGLIPDDTDILVTHGPPFGHGDLTMEGHYVGCEDLLRAVERIKPRLHIFGHIHESYGISYNEHTVFINASICDRTYRPNNQPIVYEL